MERALIRILFAVLVWPALALAQPIVGPVNYQDLPSGCTAEALLYTSVSGNWSCTTIPVINPGTTGQIAYYAGSGSDLSPTGLISNGAGGLSTASGQIFIKPGAGGNLDLFAGDAATATSDGTSVSLQSGDGGGTSGSGGELNIAAGSAPTSGDGGGLSVSTGNGAGTNMDGGDLTINLGVGTGAGSPGNLIVSALPTANPSASNSIWSDSGFLVTGAPTFPSSIPISCANLPALTGDTTTSAGSCATTTGKVNGVSYNASPSTNTVPVVTGSNATTYEALPLAALATQTANTFVANVSGSTAAPTAASLPSCSATGSALNYTSGTGVGCVTGLAPLASPALTGTPTAPTAAANLNASTQLATVSFANNAAITGVTTITTASGTVSMSSTQLANPIILVTSALTGNLILTTGSFPSGRWTVDNASSGAYTVTVKTASGTGIVVPQGSSATVIGDGTNVIFGAGNVVGPSSAVSLDCAAFSGVTGALLADSTSSCGTNNSARGNLGANVLGATGFGVGTAQHERYVFYGSTTGSSTFTLTEDGNAAGAHNIANLSDNSAYSLTVSGIILDLTSGGAVAFQCPGITGAVVQARADTMYRGSGAATTVLGTSGACELQVPAGSITLTGMSVTLAADTTNGGLTVTVTPQTGNSDTEHAVAYLSVVQVQ